MSDESDRAPLLDDRTGLTVLAAVSATLALVVLLPYLNYVLLAVVLAYVLEPAQRRLEQVIGGTGAALALVVAAILTIVIPILYLLAIAIREALEIANAVQEGDISQEDVESRLETVGLSADLADLYATYQEPIATGVQGLATTTIEFVGGVPGILIGLTVTTFVLFSLLRDGHRLVAWLLTVVPVERRLSGELLAELDRLMWASVVGNVAVAAIQAVLLGIGLAVVGVPAVIFLTVVTFVLALLPMIGAFGVWLPVSLYLLAIGRPLAAVFVVGYGTLVSASDTYLRPALIGNRAAFDAATIVVGIFGGIVVFGAVGLFVGPVVIGGAKAALDIYARERETGDTAS